MDSPETEFAQQYLTHNVHILSRDKSLDIKHCELNLVIGSVMMTARYKLDNFFPSIAALSINDHSGLHKPEEKSADKEAQLRKPQMKFRPRHFMSVLKHLETSYPGSTIWDAGSMSFLMDNRPYPYPARILLCRSFKKRNKDVETFDFRVTGEGENGDEDMAMLLRARDSGQDPGGVLCVAAVVTLNPEIEWPARDVDSSYAIMQAALAQLSKHILIMAFTDGFNKSVAMRIWVGQENMHWR